jgi:uncharacterized membrane protein
MAAGTPRLPAGRTVFWWLAGGLIAVVLGTLPRLPPVVASHFGATGAPNGWSSRFGYVLLVLIIGIGLPLGVIGLVHAMTARGPAGLNIPSRAYWMAPSRQGQLVELVRAYIWWLGVLLTGIALAVHLAVLGANAVNPPRLRGVVIVPLLVAAVAGMAAWAVGWYRVLRPPVGS